MAVVLPVPCPVILVELNYRRWITTASVLLIECHIEYTILVTQLGRSEGSEKVGVGFEVFDLTGALCPSREISCLQS